MTTTGYRSVDCPNCGRGRVEADGVCEKCGWDVDHNGYVLATRPEEFDENNVRLGKETVERIHREDEERWKNLGQSSR